jgi:hypothetical protein
MGRSAPEILSHGAAVLIAHSRESVNSSSCDGEEGGAQFELAYTAHPLGVKPSGNALAAYENAAGNMGYFGMLPDEAILLLLEWFDSKSLLRLGASCRGFYAYTTFDPLWKDLFLLYAESPCLSFFRLNSPIQYLASNLLSWTGTCHVNFFDCRPCLYADTRSFTRSLSTSIRFGWVTNASRTGILGQVSHGMGVGARRI